jgi:DNA-binding SARP family transcriptional activator
MRFGLLGPLLVRGADEAVPVAGSRLRVLLAALLLHADTPVSWEVLAEAVWDGAPPRGAARTLRSHIRRLRRALGTQAAARIVASGPGYLMDVRPGELDVLEFEALCRESGDALRARSWNEASHAASRALALCRGEPLLDIPSQVLRDGFVPRLEQLRLQVLEDHAEAELQLGRHERLVPQLRELARAHPLRERLRCSRDRCTSPVVQRHLMLGILLGILLGNRVVWAARSRDPLGYC